MKDDSEEYRQDLQRTVKQDPVRLDTDGEMWNQVLEKIEASEKQERKISFYWYASAASILIILTSGLAFFYFKENTNNSTDVISHQIQEPKSDPDTGSTEINKKPELTSPEKTQSEEKTVELEIFQTSDKVELYQLADGSEITLNASGDVRIKTYHNTNIEVDLSGEAYFDVVPGLNRFFKVNFSSSSLEVIGTKFSVRNISEEGLQEVLVSEGTVKVTVKNNKKIILNKGAFLQIDKKSGKFEVKNVNPSHYLSWKTGRLRFSETPLPEVAEVLNRKYNTRIEVENNIKSCTFTGDLSEMSLEDALKVIEVTTSTEINSNTNHVIKISGAGCN